ncbi:hypothetical protein [Algoriphagus terrigena]|nr:hypothetical protein [Algoriphagus terrigena]
MKNREVQLLEKQDNAGEHNLLINPLHKDFNHWVKIKEEWDVSFEVNQ